MLKEKNWGQYTQQGVDITIPDKFNYNLLAHELQHAYQFEVGEYALAIQKDPKILDFISDILIKYNENNNIDIVFSAGIASTCTT